MIDPELTDRRLLMLEEHFASEVEQDFRRTVATFAGTPRYEIVPTGQVHEGEVAVIAYHTSQRRAFPDQRHENVRMHVAEDDIIIAEFDLLGTNLGRFHGVEPTGKSFRVRTIAVFSFDGEFITNERVYLDLSTMFHQIGRPDLLQRIRP